jgi:ribulose-5-phosphate 4-epimerase/fuculose-1-phosphate aldolase
MAGAVDLAACYRLCERYGMSDMIYTHITARVPDAPDQFLINPNGMLFSEITASPLLKVNIEGDSPVPPADMPYGLHPAGFTIHSAIYRARPDAMAAMHTHTIAGMAVSALKCGLLPLTQTATRFYGRIAYHDFRGPERDPAERESLAAQSIGSHNYCILRNHGLLTIGSQRVRSLHRHVGPGARLPGAARRHGLQHGARNAERGGGGEVVRDVRARQFAHLWPAGMAGPHPAARCHRHILAGLSAALP